VRLVSTAARKQKGLEVRQVMVRSLQVLSTRILNRHDHVTAKEKL